MSPLLPFPPFFVSLCFFKVDSLPNSITHLKFGKSFNQPLNNPPPALQLVKFGKSFRHSNDNLPNSIHTLKITTRDPIHNLPSSLTKLNHASKISNVLCPLPPSIKWLKISGGGELYNLSALSLIELTVVGQAPGIIEKLPSTLQKLDFWGQGACTLALDSLPASVTHLTLWREDYNTSLDYLPSLTHLKLLENEGPALIHTIPSTVTHFYFGNVDGLPNLTNNPHLIHLTFDDNFNEPVPDLPFGIKQVRGLQVLCLLLASKFCAKKNACKLAYIV